MVLWLTLAVLAGFVGWLLMRSPASAAGDMRSGDIAVYRDQLAELEADAARGLIGPAEAEAARTEIARRMLKSADEPAATSKGAGPGSGAMSRHVLAVCASAVPVLALVLYLKLGAPGLPSRPLQARLAEPAAESGKNAASVNDIMAKIENHLREHPDDGRGWSVIAPAYLSQGRAREAALAYERAVALAGETVERLVGLAKANLLIADGIVNETARTAYERVRKLDPDNPQAAFWLATYEEQNGRTAAALEGFRKLAAAQDKDSPWRSAAEQRIEALTGDKASGSASPAPAAPENPGPLRKDPTPAEFVAAAQKLEPAMREAMIGGRMIPKAEAAVKQNPKDFPAWSRIVTGHVALGHVADARTALGDARKAADGDATALSALDKLAAELGLNS